MKITNITVTPFRTWVDRYQNGEPLPRTEVVQTLTTIETDEGATGHYLGGQGHGDQDGSMWSTGHISSTGFARC